MNKDIINTFKLKKSKHKMFGTVYEYNFQKSSYVVDEIALMYALVDIERWSKEMQKYILAQQSSESTTGEKEE